MPNSSLIRPVGCCHFTTGPLFKHYFTCETESFMIFFFHALTYWYQRKGEKHKRHYIMFLAVWEKRPIFALTGSRAVVLLFHQVKKKNTSQKERRRVTFSLVMNTAWKEKGQTVPLFWHKLFDQYYCGPPLFLDWPTVEDLPSWVREKPKSCTVFSYST